MFLVQGAAGSLLLIGNVQREQEHVPIGEGTALLVPRISSLDIYSVEDQFMGPVGGRHGQDNRIRRVGYTGLAADVVR